MARGSRRRGNRFNPAKLLTDPYARAITGQLDDDDAVFGHVRGGDAAVRDDRDSAAHVPRSVVVGGGFDWAGDEPPSVSWSDTTIYELHVRGFTRRHPAVPAGAAGHVRRTGSPRSDPAPDRPRRHRGRAAARASLRHREPAGAQRSDELLGLQLPRLLRPARRIRSLRQQGAASHRVQADGEGAARSRPRSHPRRRLQPHRRGRRAGSDPVVPWHRQRRVLQARERPTSLRRLHGDRQHARPVTPARTAAGHGLAALLGAGDARRRLPFRPGVRARPFAARRRHAERVPHDDPAGSVAVTGETHRRAVGRRRRGLSGRRVPAAVVGVERPVPRHGPRLLARSQRRGPRTRLSAVRLVRPLRRRWPTAVLVGQLHHGSRRIHVAGPGDVRPQAQRGQRRAQPGRLRPQPFVEPRRRGRDRRPRDRGLSPPHDAHPCSRPSCCRPACR